MIDRILRIERKETELNRAFLSPGKEQLVEPVFLLAIVLITRTSVREECTNERYICYIVYAMVNVSSNFQTTIYEFRI